MTVKPEALEKIRPFARNLSSEIVATGYTGFLPPVI
jgi:hypothetical protein